MNQASYGFEPNAKAGSMDVERAMFLQKVYGLLTTSCLVAAGGAQLGTTLPREILWPCFFGGLILMFAAFAFRKTPVLNVCLLFGFTFVQGLSIGPLLGALAGAGFKMVIAQALILTVSMFGGLTAYVFWAKKDFGYLGGFCTGGLFALLGVGLISMFTGMSPGVNLLYSVIGVLVFLGYILYDTSNIIHRFPVDEYVPATLELFMDLMNLFLYLLRFLVATQSRDD